MSEAKRSGVTNKFTWVGRGRPPAPRRKVEKAIEKCKKRIHNLDRLLEQLERIPDGVYDKWRDGTYMHYYGVREQLREELEALTHTLGDLPDYTKE